MSDRKYRHRGYQDTGVKPSGKPSGPPPEPRRERLEGAPRGRSAGAPGPEVFQCHRCGQKRSSADVEFDTVCVKCASDLHTCSNCKNFDTSARWECRVSDDIPARVTPKDVRNECALFAPRVIRDLVADKGKAPVTVNDARKAFDDLFKK